MTRPDYIFIAGLDRTGTTLVRDILNCSDEVGIGGESKFLRRRHHLALRFHEGFRHTLAKVGNISTDAGAERVVDYIFSDQPKPTGYWDFQSKGFDRDEFLRVLLASDRSERSLFSITLDFYARGKPIGGEKTPAHIEHVPMLLEWYPNSKIIHTFRDPRAIYISRMKKTNRAAVSRTSATLRSLGLVYELYASSDVIMSWQHVIRLHRRYQSHYPDRYYLSKYEDLVRNPRGCLPKLCEFLEIDFTEEMLQPAVVNSSHIPKAAGASGFDTSAIERWRKYLHPAINKWFLLWLKNQLVEFNYTP